MSDQQYLVEINNKLFTKQSLIKLTVSSDASASSPDSLYATVTKIMDIPANGSAQYHPTEPIEYLQVVDQESLHPLATTVFNSFESNTETLIIDSSCEQAFERAFAFYKQYKAQPYGTDAIQINEILIEKPIQDQKTNLNKWFSENKVGFDYDDR